MPSAPSKNSAAVQKVVIALGSLAVIAGAYYASSMKAQVPMISSGPADAKADTAVTDAIAPALANASDAASALDSGDAASLADASPYDVHMSAGAELAKAKKYAEAIAEFSLALKERADDAKALAERGSAKFETGDVRSANEDLATALTKTKDAEILADIWLRRAALDQKLFGEEAKSAYVASWAISGSKETESKMGTRCDHMTERRDLNAKIADAAADPVLHSALNVAALFPSLPGWNEQHEALPDAGKPTETQVWTAATDSATAPLLPTIVRLYDYTKAVSYLVFRARSRIWALQLSFLFNVWNATGNEEFKVVTADAGRIHAHGYYAQAKEEVTPIPGGNAHATLEGSLAEVDAVVDLAKNRVLWITRDKPGRFAERETTPSMKASLVEGGLSLQGLGCNEVIPVIEGTNPKDASPRD